MVIERAADFFTFCFSYCDPISRFLFIGTTPEVNHKIRKGLQRNPYDDIIMFLYFLITKTNKYFFIRTSIFERLPKLHMMSFQRFNFIVTRPNDLSTLKQR